MARAGQRRDPAGCGLRRARRHCRAAHPPRRRRPGPPQPGPPAGRRRGRRARRCPALPLWRRPAGRRQPGHLAARRGPPARAARGPGVRAGVVSRRGRDPRRRRSGRIPAAPPGRRARRGADPASRAAGRLAGIRARRTRLRLCQRHRRQRRPAAAQLVGLGGRRVGRPRQRRRRANPRGGRPRPRSDGRARPGRAAHRTASARYREPPARPAGRLRRLERPRRADRRPAADTGGRASGQRAGHADRAGLVRHRIAACRGRGGQCDFRRHRHPPARAALQRRAGAPRQSWRLRLAGRHCRRGGRAGGRRLAVASGHRARRRARTRPVFGRGDRTRPAGGRRRRLRGVPHRAGRRAQCRRAGAGHPVRRHLHHQHHARRRDRHRAMVVCGVRARHAPRMRTCAPWRTTCRR
ncbi:Uncharacterised protein [Bordetella pertussis]|nr:Uncharacterised protein [Bordetella pertussis]